MNTYHLAIILLGLIVSVGSHAESTRYVHFLYQNTHTYGVVESNKARIIEGDIFGKHDISDVTVSLDQVELLPATQPSKIIAVGLNYSSHFSSSRGSIPKLFSKLTSSLTAHNKPIWLFPNGDNLHFEGELVVVIGKKAHNISVKDAPNYIFGVTAGNDVTERSWQGSDLQWLRGKGADSFAPVAPWIVTNTNYNDLLIETRLNGETVQSESTKNLLFNVDEIVSYASRYHTLYPGDLIFTGTPGRTRAMKEGDVVEVEIQNIGSVSNTVTKY